MRARAVLLMIATVLLAGCESRSEGPFRPAIDAAATPGDATGEELYLRDCAWCHGDRAGGTERGPDLVSGTNGPALTDFVLTTGRMPIDDPDDEMRPGPPPYDPEETSALVGYLSSLQLEGPEIPELHLATADIAVGNELYADNCAACHSSVGIGGALTGGEIATPLKKSTALQVAEAIRTGPGTMPVFGPDTLSDDDVDAVVAYVRTIQNPDNRGGADLGGIGPVAEGAVAIFIGLLTILAVTRAIGTRADE